MFSRKSKFFVLGGLMTLLVTAPVAFSQTLVQPGNLDYLGTFRVPTPSGNNFAYGGSALAYNPSNDSLFMVGSTNEQLTGEISIPALGGTASIIQPLTDSLGGKRGAVGPTESRIGGNLVYKNKLYVSAFVFYDASGEQTQSHFSRSLSLGSGSVTGPYRMGSLGAGFYSGYMSPIPTEWQARLGGPALVGNCCLSIISRTSFGPAAFAFDPEGTAGSAQPLVYYPSDHTTLGNYSVGGSRPIFNGTTRITAVIFPPGTSSVLFFGMTGIGNWCYGEPGECGGDPMQPYKGDHAYPYRAYVWAYDANDLAAVRSGQKQPWQVTPYRTWELPDMGDVSGDFGVGGAAFDPVSGRIFIAKSRGDDANPLIYVYKINNSVQLKMPMPPGNTIVR
jgi:hypothetical protein